MKSGISPPQPTIIKSRKGKGNVYTNKIFSDKAYREEFINVFLYFSSLNEFTKIISERALMQMADAGDGWAVSELTMLRNSDQRDVFEETIAALPRNLARSGVAVPVPGELNGYVV